jgi:hypothetical protein
MSRPPENKPANLPVFPECDVSLDAPDDASASADWQRRRIACSSSSSSSTRARRGLSDDVADKMRELGLSRARLGL